MPRSAPARRERDDRRQSSTGRWHARLRRKIFLIVSSMIYCEHDSSTSSARAGHAPNADAVARCDCGECGRGAALRRNRAMPEVPSAEAVPRPYSYITMSAVPRYDGRVSMRQQSTRRHTTSSASDDASRERGIVALGRDMPSPPRCARKSRRLIAAAERHGCAHGTSALSPYDDNDTQLSAHAPASHLPHTRAAVLMKPMAAGLIIGLSPLTIATGEPWWADIAKYGDGGRGMMARPARARF